MTIVFAFGIVLKVSFVLALTLGALPLLGRGSASVRRWVILLGVCASLAVPLLAVGFPRRPLVHVQSTAFVGHVVAEALLADVAPMRLQRVQHLTATALSSPLQPTGFLPMIWSVGALFVLARVLYGAAGAWRLSATSQPTRPARAGVRVSTGIEAPVVVGVFRPIVLLPAESRTWSEERMHAVLLHEFSHVQKRDGLALLLAQFACALYWFHPLAWLARSRLRRECELAADETVIASGLRATSYAQLLLEIARASVPTVGISMAARPSELSRRIHALIARDGLPAPLNRTRAALLAVASTLVFGGVACVDAGSTADSKTPSANASAAPPTRGLDTQLQAIAEEEARRVHGDWGAERVAILILDPHTGALLANADDAPGKVVVPGSTLKPLTVATALEVDAISAGQQFDCGNGQRNYGSLVLRDAGQYGSLDAAQILAVSSNIGVSRIFDALGGERLGDGLRRFRVGAPPEIPSGTMRGAIIAIGQGSTTTPLAMASAFGVLANDGVLAASGSAPVRVIKAATAKTVRGMLEGAVNGEHATGKAAAVAGVRVGGKTGTSDEDNCASCAPGGGTFASFVGIVPIDSPRWVIYVGVGKPSKEGSGGTIAAPAFSRVAKRALEL
ncbi:MAG TPA: penicillin-binding transpeptidase domain-containing protein [Polyangiaceae bacterium]|nr:penicillin-binding transpeptidase domain-containing protein [Polyangiaceae bacterium]